MPTLRDWLDFWGQNLTQSYRAASDHGSLFSFLGAIVTSILGVAGVSLLTTSKVWTALGAGLGIIAWFLFLALFVTPAKMWAEARRASLPLMPTLVDGLATVQSFEFDEPDNVASSQVTKVAMLSAVIATPDAEDLKLRIDGAVPPMLGPELPLYIAPEKAQARHYIADKVSFRIAILGDDPPRLFVAGEEVYDYALDYQLIGTIVGRGGRPTMVRLRLKCDYEKFGVSLLAETVGPASVAVSSARA